MVELNEYAAFRKWNIANLQLTGFGRLDFVVRASMRTGEVKTFHLVWGRHPVAELSTPYPWTSARTNVGINELPRHGNRHYYLPSSAFLAALVWIASSAPKVPRWIAW
jgi:hypothetical protein